MSQAIFRQTAVTVIIAGDCRVQQLGAGSRTATYRVAVVRYEQDPWDPSPVVVDEATITLEAGIDLLSSEVELSKWIGESFPGWSYLSSVNACTMQVFNDGPEPF